MKAGPCVLLVLLLVCVGNFLTGKGARAIDRTRDIGPATTHLLPRTVRASAYTGIGRREHRDRYRHCEQPTEPKTPLAGQC